MAQFRIVTEQSTVRFTAKVFEADSLEDALDQAEGEDWREEGEDGWEEYDQSTGGAEIREDLCEAVEDADDAGGAL